MQRFEPYVTVRADRNGASSVLYLFTCVCAFKFCVCVRVRVCAYWCAYGCALVNCYQSTASKTPYTEAIAPPLSGLKHSSGVVTFQGTDIAGLGYTEVVNKLTYTFDAGQSLQGDAYVCCRIFDIENGASNNWEISKSLVHYNGAVCTYSLFQYSPASTLPVSTV